MLCHGLPGPHRGDIIRAYYLARILSKDYGYRITVVYFGEQGINETQYKSDLSEYCQVISPAEIYTGRSLLHRASQFSKSVLSRQNILRRNPSFLNYYYDPRMASAVEDLLSRGGFDAIYSQGGMAQYAVDSALPKIADPQDAVSYGCYQEYVDEKHLRRKVLLLSEYLLASRRERKYYGRFGFCTVVTDRDKILLESMAGLANVRMIPNGTDVSYFAPMTVEEDYPSLMFLGIMSGGKNIRSVLRFYTQIYPLVREEFPNVRFYIVGSDPSPEIVRLSKDKSVIVTGFVQDVRPYVGKASVVVAPIFEGTGIKSKVLQPMAMGRPVVTTSIGALGIEAVNGKELLVADTDSEFAACVLQLLGDTHMRERMGMNARELITAKYSWTNTATMFHSCFAELVSKK
jgi:sugar transferase (PEP-CTERM/EpsH1 system associated)